jgi:hypothetical protein
MSTAEDRTAFAERIRLQLESRYRGYTVAVDPARFAVRLTAAGVDATLPLTPLHTAVQREPARTASLIADFVRAAEVRLQARPGAGFSTARVLWCVRSRSYLDELSRAGELLTREVAGDLVGFVAEALPGSIMRGIPRGEWSERGYSDGEIAAAADRATAERFAPVAQRVLGAERLTRDGWQYAGDPLFASSLLVVPAVLRAFADRAGGEVYVGVPDRALLLAIPASAPGSERFGRRVLQAYRDALTPCSREVLVTDGSNLRVLPREGRSRRGPSLMAWLQD